MQARRDTLDIETAGDSLTLNILRNDVLGVYVRGDATADYALDVSPTGTNWMEAAETFSGTAINFGGFEAAQYVRLRVTTGTATAGDSADVFLVGSGAD